MEGPVYELLIDIHKDMGIMKSEISEIKVDLKDHMRRTAMNEASIEMLKKALYMSIGGFSLLSLLGTIAGIVRYFN